MSATFPSSRPIRPPRLTNSGPIAGPWARNGTNIGCRYGSRSVGADEPHGEELRAAAVGVAEGDLGAVDLVLARLSTHLHRGLREAQHPAGPDGIGRQHSPAHVDGKIAVHLGRPVLHH